MRWFVLLLVWTPGSAAAIVDRIAVVVDRQVITETQVDEDLRVAALINQENVPQDPQARRAAAHRLVDQSLILHEMELGNYPAPTSLEIETYFAQVKAALGAEDFNGLLANYGLDESTLKEHLATQLTILRFVEYRFQPQADDRPLAKGPDNAHSENQVPDKLTASASTDALLETWLEEHRKQAKIEYLDRSLQ